MNVSLTPELEQFVQAKVESGRYNSAREVVRGALRLLGRSRAGAGRPARRIQPGTRAALGIPRSGRDG